MTIAFVTGGTGFLGRHLVTRLVTDGWTVRALHRAPADAERLRALGAEPVRGDLGDPASLARAVAGTEVVFHAAALFKMWAPKAAFEQANVDGTRHLLAAAQAAGVARFIQIGASGVVMSAGRSMIGVTEDAPLAFPDWAPYLASKARAEQLVLAADDPAGMRTMMVLPPMIWGADMPMLGETIANIEAGRFAWPGGGASLMSTAHVDNVAHAALLAARRGAGGRAYFVTDGEDRTLREVIGQLLATRGVDAGTRSAPLGVAWFMATVMERVWRTFRLAGEPPLTRQMLRMVGYDFTISDRRAREELGYAPVITWDEGVRAMSAGA
ncbi:NAD-dependent epimerase/dehydratase family protein [Sphingomonas sp. AP4-R1]|uniref:NAD-dependent epimerase/dehydratase family protein n=1 Tax=Sphingomonas sp. AP4-R1 TaxID=2735134 RepID=UPI001493CDDE|nr:NAD-dependent epimerase/dehydratase family protein [Sphingomonas sp. AP4-R1]QJU56561.1 NAD-dependent epimerase/dehydratase family protein [Sphingomonas sp. AP4-R1]